MALTGIKQRIHNLQQKRAEKKLQKGKMNQTPVAPAVDQPGVRSKLEPNAHTQARELHERQAEHSTTDKPHIVVTDKSSQDARPYGNPDDILPNYSEATGTPAPPAPTLKRQKQAVETQLKQQQDAQKKLEEKHQKLEQELQRDIQKAAGSDKKMNKLAAKSKKRHVHVSDTADLITEAKTKMAALQGEMNLLEAMERKEEASLKAPIPESTSLDATAKKTTVPEKSEAEKTRPPEHSSPSDEVEENEGATEHRSRLSNIIKPFLTLNKEEVKAADDRKKAASTEFKAAEKILKKVRNQKEHLEKDLHKAIGQGNKSEKKQKKASTKSVDLTNQLMEAEKTFEAATAQLQRLQLQLAEAEKELKNAEKNTDSLVSFATGFATSLRSLHRQSHAKKPVSADVLDKQRTIKVPKLTIETPDGRLEVANLNLKLKLLHFEQSADKQWTPVLGIERMTGKISVPMPDSQTLKLDLDIKDVEVRFDAGFGTPLHSYVTSRFGLAGAAKALAQGVKNAGKMLPRSITIKGQKIAATLDDCSAKTFAAFAHKGASTPGSGVDKLFEALGIALTAQIKELDVATKGQVELGATAQNVYVDFAPEMTPDKKQTTRKAVELSADHGKITIKKALPFIQDLASELQLSDPLALIPGMKNAKKEMTPDGLKSISDTLTVKSDFPSATISRELKHQVVKKKWKGLKKVHKWGLTGANTVKASMRSLEIANSGGINAHARLDHFGLTAIPPTDKPGSMVALAKSCQLTVNSPKGVIPSEVAGQPLTLEGKATFTVKSPEISGDFSPEGTGLTVKVPTLNASVNEPLNFRIGDQGAYLPKSMELEAHGQVKVHKGEHGLTLTPQMRLHGNDRIFITANGKKTSIDLSAEVTMNKASYYVLMRTDEATGNSVMTPVVTDGGISLQAPHLGPVAMDNLSLTLDEKNNGMLAINSLRVDLDSASSNKKVSYRAGDVEADPELTIHDPMVSRTQRWAMKNKTLELDAEITVTKGHLNLKSLKKIKPRIRSQRHAGPMDRMVTAVMNACLYFARKRLQRVELEVKNVPEMIHGKTQMVPRPFAVVSLGSIKREIPLPIPSGYVDQETDTIPLPHILREQAGIIVCPKAIFDRTMQCFSEIQAGEPESIGRLNQLCKELQRDSSGSAPLHMLAQQLPIDCIGKIYREHPKQQHMLAGLLNGCGEIFMIHPQLLNQTLQVFQITGHKTSAEQVGELAHETKTNKRTDPTAVALLMQQQGELVEAETFYEMALKRKMSTPLAHTRLGCMMLDRSAKGKIVDGSELDTAMGHLTTAALGGFSEAEERINLAEKDARATVADKAKLHVAVIALLRESVPSKEVDRLTQFHAAIERLEHLASHAVDKDVRLAALKQLNNRKKNAGKIFHTQDEEVFKKTQEEYKDYQVSVVKRKKPPKGEAAYKLGLKLFYGSAGAPHNFHHGVRLLQLAADSGIKKANSHLQALRDGVPS